MITTEIFKHSKQHAGDQGLEVVPLNLNVDRVVGRGIDEIRNFGRPRPPSRQGFKPNFRIDPIRAHKARHRPQPHSLLLMHDRINGSLKRDMIRDNNLERHELGKGLRTVSDKPIQTVACDLPNASGGRWTKQLLRTT